MEMLGTLSTRGKLYEVDAVQGICEQSDQHLHLAGAVCLATQQLKVRNMYSPTKQQLSADGIWLLGGESNLKH